MKETATSDQPWFVCLFASIKWVALDQFMPKGLNETEETQHEEDQKNQCITQTPLSLHEDHGERRKKKPCVKKKSSKKSKTFISVTMNPSQTLRDIRNGVIALPGAKRDSKNTNDALASEMASNMEIACLVGPIESPEKAFAFRKSWEMTSRGLVSRSTTGSVLAKRYKYRCSINWYAFYRLRREDMHIQENTDGEGNVTSLVFTIIRCL